MDVAILCANIAWLCQLRLAPLSSAIARITEIHQTDSLPVPVGAGGHNTACLVALRLLPPAFNLAGVRRFSSGTVHTSTFLLCHNLPRGNRSFVLCPLLAAANRGAHHAADVGSLLTLDLGQRNMVTCLAGLWDVADARGVGRGTAIEDAQVLLIGWCQSQ